MSFELLSTTPRSATFEVRNGTAFESAEPHRVLLDGRAAFAGLRNVFTLSALEPGRSYAAAWCDSGQSRTLRFRTPAELARLDPCDFGAAADGRTDDTAAIQAAIDACPAGGTVVFASGTWLSGPLFLKSGVDLWLQHDARIVGHGDIERWPVLPAVLARPDGARMNAGSWEGEPADCHAGLITGLGVSRVRIHGAGTIDGNASFSTWWSRPKGRFGGWRPRLIYLVECSDVDVQGVRLCNAPSWTLHALRSRNLRFVDLAIDAPADSPNTDGIDPESCENVMIAGARISTGDDCVAIKSGKCGPEAAPPPPTRHVAVSNCHMARGHGAVVLGSELSGGIYDVETRDCRFDSTDRVLRIKTRRGRGAAAIVDGVRLRNVVMRGVGTAFVLNSFYRCDPHEIDRDARRFHVDDRGPRPADAGTPTIRNLEVLDVDCRDARHSAGLVLGLPERPVENLRLCRYRVGFAASVEPGCPDMADSIGPVARQGLVLCNVRGVALEEITLEGVVGPTVVRENVE